jgi:glutaredoxin-related protein
VNFELIRKTVRILESIVRDKYDDFNIVRDKNLRRNKIKNHERVPQQKYSGFQQLCRS